VRVAGASAVLLPLLRRRGEWPALRTHWRPIALVGLTNSALPFLCFTVAALAGGAEHVSSVDSSAPALERVQAHVQLNGFKADASSGHDGDANAFLRASLEAGHPFDAIVLDPPKFAPTAAHAERAARAYKDINRLAFKLLAPGGLLFTFSCSGGISADLFHKIVAGAAADAGVDGAIVQRLEAACDHPTTMEFPEGEYLKGLAIVKQA